MRPHFLHVCNAASKVEIAREDLSDTARPAHRKLLCVPAQSRTQPADLVVARYATKVAQKAQNAYTDDCQGIKRNPRRRVRAQARYHPISD